VVEAPVGRSNDGLQAVRELRRGNRGLPLILVTTHGSEDLAVAALRAGVTDYFNQASPPQELALGLRRYLASSTSAGRPEGGLTLLGESTAIQHVRARIQRVASTDSNVLVTGETGTGKELVAGLIHENSRRRGKPLVCINCAAIPDTLFESELFGYERGAFTGAQVPHPGKLAQAAGGTVFFDEIGDMSPYAQAKILRAIESHEVHRLGGRGSIPLDVRVIAATNRDLARLVEEERFRSDLYFRLDVNRIHLPPLRERREDIPMLLGHYVGDLSARLGQEVEGYTDEALEAMLRYHWPGNVRELRNVLESMLVTGGGSRLTIDDLPERVRARAAQAASVPLDERARVLAALSATKWNKSSAAQKLHWSRMTLYRKIAKHHIVRARTSTSMAPSTPVAAPGGLPTTR
jgi:DNA-binding NtrC family response regulator